MSRSYLYYCGKLDLGGRMYSHFDIMNRDCPNECVFEGEIEAPLCNLDRLVKNVIVEDALPSNEPQDNDGERESPFSASHDSKCNAPNEVLIRCSKSGSELLKGISLEKNNRREKILDDVTIRTYTGLSSESVPECPLRRPEKVPCNVPVSEKVEESLANKQVSEVCDLVSPSKASAVELPYICKENVVQSCDTIRESYGTSGQKGMPSNKGGWKYNIVTRYLNEASHGECNRNPVAEFAVEVNGVTVIIKEFAVPCQEDQNDPISSTSTSENISIDSKENLNEHSNSQIEIVSHRTNETKASDDYEQVNENEENQETSRGETSRKGDEHLIQCNKCPSSHKSFEAMITHFLKDHITTKCLFKCPFSKCPSTISYRTAATHIRGHVKEEIYTCQHCLFSTWHKGGFSRHIAAHKLDALRATDG
ncbi:zinc finger protein 37-like [Penaeus monodon]|uniref:zinc finger protein 37-like n=1 Tax=Penaeus monodon TaxID=6687 RepID=UPI0018A7A302|nr:zinc finger protein 37-like [Penaeus monodon]